MISMSSDEYITFPAVELAQPIGTFYVGVIDWQDLLQISYADIRRIEARDLERVIGIQRPLTPSRVAELKKYVTTVDASFPTSVIVAIEGENADYDENTGTMKVKRDAKVAKIIDGQHRLAGLENYRGPSFQLNVTIFVDMELEDQALLFATINLKQTKVSKSLAYDLFDYATARSPQKTCHNIAKLLNMKDGSPFKDKIKILGRATGKPAETLTQAAFVDRLIGYVSDDPMVDRDGLKRGRKLKRADASEEKRLIFRNMFIDEKDAEIAKILWNFFDAVANRWPRAWPERIRGNILNRTTGFAALMRFLRDAYNSVARPGQIVARSEFESLFRHMELDDADFTPEIYKPGTSGESALYRDLLEQSGLGRA